MLELRNQNRYGLFSAKSNIGKIQISISICGFGECIEVFKDKKSIAYVETLNDEDSYYEDEIKLYIDNIIIEKPFTKCLKRYK